MIANDFICTFLKYNIALMLIPDKRIILCIS